MPQPPPRTFDLARVVAPVARELSELHRRFVVEEQRLTAELGADEPPSFEDFVAWIVDRGGRPPRRPKGSQDRRPGASQNRSRAQRRRREQERQRLIGVGAAA